MKNKNEQFKNIFRFLIIFALVISQVAVFSYFWLLYYNEQIVFPFYRKGHIFFYVVYALLLFIFLKSFDGLKYATYRKANIMTAQVLATVTTLFIIYLQIILLAAGYVSPRPLIQALVIDVILIFIIALLGEFILKKLFPARKTLLVWDVYPPDDFLQKLKSRKDKFSIFEIVNVSEGFEHIEPLIKQAEAVVVYDVHAENRNKIIKCCYENDVRSYCTTKVSDILIRSAKTLYMFDTPLLLNRNAGLGIEQRFVKRSFDIIFSLLLLIITSPLMLISAVLIKLYDGGPILFKQARGTKNGKIFFIHKFRSMIVDAEKDGAKPAEENDSRITPVGKFLRAARFDELPQLIDILVGNMSFVGPRPERIEHIKQYTEEIPEFSYRLKVRGGLTGFAQLYGKYNTTPYDKLQLDLMYIENYSIFLDIKLLLMTVKIMFMKESTEGFTKEKSEKINKKSKENK